MAMATIHVRMRTCSTSSRLLVVVAPAPRAVHSSNDRHGEAGTSKQSCASMNLTSRSSVRVASSMSCSHPGVATMVCRSGSSAYTRVSGLKPLTTACVTRRSWSERARGTLPANTSASVVLMKYSKTRPSLRRKRRCLSSVGSETSTNAPSLGRMDSTSLALVLLRSGTRVLLQYAEPGRPSTYTNVRTSGVKGPGEVMGSTSSSAPMYSMTPLAVAMTASECARPGSAVELRGFGGAVESFPWYDSTASPVPTVGTVIGHGNDSRRGHVCGRTRVPP